MAKSKIANIAVGVIVAAMLIPALAYLGFALLLSHHVGEESRKSEALMQQIEAENNNKGTIVYALTDIKEGAPFLASDLEERQVQVTKIPETAIGSIASTKGLRATVDIAAGTILLDGHLSRKKSTE